MSLAASTIVDSSYSSLYLPSFTLKVSLGKFRITVFHSRHGSADAEQQFNGFIIDEDVMDEIYSKTFELLQFSALDMEFNLKRLQRDLYMEVRRH